MSSQSPDPWENQPYMYSKPSGPRNLKIWREKWANYILKHAEESNLLLVNLLDFKNRKPFDRLDMVSFLDLIEHLNSMGRVAWWDKKKESIRIHFISLDKWAEIIFDAAVDNHKNVIYGFEGVYDLEPRTRNMPPQDIERIMEIWVKNKKARWVEPKNKILKISVDY